MIYPDLRLPSYYSFHIWAKPTTKLVANNSQVYLIIIVYLVELSSTEDIFQEVS